MVKKARLGLYLEDEEIKKKVKIAAAKQGISITAYCAQAIEERLRRDGELDSDANRRKIFLLSRIDKLRQEIGPINTTAAELIDEGRRR